MRITKCDCCGEEIEEFRNQTFEFLCHLHPDNKWVGHTDCKGNPTSGRKESLDLCGRCYNDIVGTAMKHFLKLNKERYNNE